MKIVTKISLDVGGSPIAGIREEPLMRFARAARSDPVMLAGP
jgi:hypothetical protein